MGRSSGSRRQAFLADSESEDEEFQLSEQAYLAGGLAEALRRPEDFCSAASELAALLAGGVYRGRATKAAQAAILRDVAAAVACCSGCARQHAARRGPLLVGRVRFSQG